MVKTPATKQEPGNTRADAADDAHRREPLLKLDI
jgi:hypothetical protein